MSRRLSKVPEFFSCKLETARSCYKLANTVVTAMIRVLRIGFREKLCFQANKGLEDELKTNKLLQRVGFQLKFSEE